MAEKLWHALGPHIRTYKLNVQQVVPVSARHLHINGRTGSFEAVVTSPNHAMARRTIADWAARQGMRRVQRHLVNMYDERWRDVNENQVLYVTNNWDGKRLGVTPNDVLEAGENLARLHNALDGSYEPLRQMGSELQQRHGQWVQRLADAASQFPAGGSDDKNTSSGTARLWNDWLERWRDLAGRALEQFDRHAYEDWAASAAERNDIAWNGYRLRNLTRVHGGGVAIDQTLDPIADHPLYDLASLCTDIAEAGYTDGLVETVEVYALHRPLSEQDRALILSFAAFPHAGLRLLHAKQRRQLELDEDDHWRQQAEQQFSAAERLLECISK